MYPVERARALLRHLLLKGGGTPAREVHAAAMRAGVPVWALRKARRTMTIAVRFVGFGPDGRWEWRWEHPPTWRPPAKQEQAAQQVSLPLCRWRGCGLPPRSEKAAYCAIHKALSVRQTKRAWARKDRALLRRARTRLAARRR